MKIILCLILTLCVATFAIDQTEVVATTTTTNANTSTGTLLEFTPGKTFILKDKTGPMPYQFGKTTEYLTKKGRKLTEEEVRTSLKAGTPVSVHYSSIGETRIISRIEADIE